MQYCQTRCEGCPFGGPRVGSKGPIDSPFVIVGESPGKEELRHGMPFMGQSGQIVDHATKQHTLPHPIYYTNAIQCFPGTSEEKNESTMMQAVQACRGRLLTELALHPRKIVLAMGAPAAWSLTNDFKLKITKVRGNIWPSPIPEIERGILTSVHPAFLLRGSGSLRQFRADVDYFQRLALGEPLRKSGSEAITWSVLSSVDEINRLAESFQAPEVEVIAADTETDGFDHVDNLMLCIGLSSDGKHVYVVPEDLLPHMDPLLRSPAKYVWHSGKFDYKFVRKHGAKSVRVDDDTMLMSYALDEQRGVHDLEQVSFDWLNSPNWKAMLEKHLPSRKSSYRMIPTPILYEYMAYDVGNTWHLNRILRPKVAKDPLAELLYTKTLIPGSKYLARVEEHGARVDPKQVADNYKRLREEEDKYEDEFHAISRAAGCGDVNPRSPKQLIPFLFDTLGIRTRERSTDKDVLKHLAPHPALKALGKYRKVQKARSTYVSILGRFEQPRYAKSKNKEQKYVVSSDGCVHTSFLLHGTPTGRLASRDPNMQNIPRDPYIRGQFVCAPGRVIIEADLNQAELRSLACLSGDKVLCKIYTTEGMSLHTVTQRSIYDHPDNYSPANWLKWAEMFTVPTEDIQQGDKLVKWHDRVLEEQKMRSKAVNFGIVYGREAPSLAEEFETTVKETQRWIEGWAKTYIEAWEFIKVCRNAPALNKNLRTPFGRRKRVKIVTPRLLKTLQNEAANFPHQSIAADITNQSGIESYEYLEATWDAFIWNTVHDSNLIDAPDDIPTIRSVVKYTCDLMEAIPPKWGLTRIPFKAEAKIGTRWGSLTDQHKYFKALEQKEAA